MNEDYMPKMVWMEVDINNKEIPIRIADSSSELAFMSGAKESTIVTTASRWRDGKAKRFVKVWIDGV